MSSGGPADRESQPDRSPRVFGLTVAQWTVVAPVLRDYGPTLVLLWMVVFQMPKIQQAFHDELRDERTTHDREVERMADRHAAQNDRMATTIREGYLKLADAVRNMTEEIKRGRAKSPEEGCDP